MSASVSDGLWVDNGVDAGEFRKALGASLVVPDATGVAPRPGRLMGPGNPLVVAPTAPASMAVQVNAGKAHTYRSAAYGGTFGFGPDGVVTVPIPAAPASGSQWHRVYLWQRDTNAPASDVATGAVIDVVSGLAASSPLAPAIPAGALLLADVVVPAGVLTVTAAMVTDRPVYTASRGGIVVVKDATELAGLPTYPSAQALVQATTRRRWHDGTQWRYDGDVLTVTNEADAVALADAYPGLTVYVTATKATGVYDGSRWVWYDSQWQTYTPKLSVAAAPPWTDITLGNGSLSGAYYRKGREVTVKLYYLAGTTTTYSGGTGPLRFSMPTGLVAKASPFTTTGYDRLPCGQVRGLGTANVDGFLAVDALSTYAAADRRLIGISSADVLMAGGSTSWNINASGHFAIGQATYETNFEA